MQHFQLPCFLDWKEKEASMKEKLNLSTQDSFSLFLCCLVHLAFHLNVVEIRLTSACGSSAQLVIILPKERSWQGKAFYFSYLEVSSHVFCYHYLIWKKFGKPSIFIGMLMVVEAWKTSLLKQKQNSVCYFLLLKWPKSIKLISSAAVSLARRCNITTSN